MLSFTKLNENNFSRQYKLIELKGKKMLCCCINDEWIVDATCKAINELIDNQIVSEEAVHDWLALQPTLTH